MATMATWQGRAAGEVSTEAESAVRERQGARLRPLPNEDVYFFVKRIDNARVVRESDPAARRACWRVFGGAFCAAVALIAVLLPNAYALMAGYQIQSLLQEQQRLVNERRVLEVEEARLLSPERLAELAGKRNLVPPEPGKVVHLQPKPDGSLALNVRGN